MQDEKIFSIDELLANPRLYHGKVISVKGYYVDEFENQALWKSPEDEKSGDMGASVWIELDENTKFFDKMAKKIAPSSHKNVIIKGTFIHELTTAGGLTFGHGHMGGWPAEIQKIACIQSLD